MNLASLKYCPFAHRDHARREMLGDGVELVGDVRHGWVLLSPSTIWSEASRSVLNVRAFTPAAAAGHPRPLPTAASRETRRSSATRHSPSDRQSNRRMAPSGRTQRGGPSRPANRSQAHSADRANATPCPPIAASIAMLRSLKTGPRETSMRGDAGGFEPSRPVLRPFEMQQRVMCEVGRRTKRATPFRSGSERRPGTVPRRTAASHAAPATDHRRAGWRRRHPRPRNRHAPWPAPRRRSIPGCASANRPRRCTSHLAAKFGEVVTVRIPTFAPLQQPLGPGREPVERVSHHFEIGRVRLR